MASEDHGHAAGVGSSETALGGDPELFHDASRGSDPRSIPDLVIELEEAEIKVGLLRPSGWRP